MMVGVKKLYHWMGTRVYCPHADLILGFLFYLEALFFLPTDPMLIVYCLERRDRALWYATIATFGSVLGGITGYCIGYMLWDYAGQAIIHHRVINYVLSPETFKYLCAQYQKHEALAVLLAAFTPIPYKAATLSAGFCKLSIAPFIVCSIIGRGARFYLFAIIIKIWGVQMKVYIERYFTLLMLFALLLIISFTWLIK